MRLLVSIKVSVLIGKLGSHLSSRQWAKLRRSQVDFALWAIPAAVLNGLVDLCVRQLALACRGALVEVVHEAYGKAEELREARPGVKKGSDGAAKEVGGRLVVLG